MTIHRIDSTHRIIEFNGVFVPQYTLDGIEWLYFWWTDNTPVEFSSMADALAYI